ncbi:MAG: phosphoenolpyruvate--protein phosphotransferase [Endozoicomonadaceae bacterium]|nr:phosphoenolpyruvate--protein phosphotransferase [Endozoicomonadaceae bacterium]
MLTTLRKIVQDVGEAKDFRTALEIIVCSVRGVMQTEVCSAYLYDEKSSRYTLMATEGLNKDAVGKVTLGRSEGLVGQVGLRGQLINIDDASSHSQYCFLKDTGEEQYKSFLGVPIIHRRNLLGVLVVQDRARRCYDESEESFLVTMSAQLSGVIAHAEATGSLHVLSAEKQKRSVRFNGIAGAPGVAIGVAVVLVPPANLSVVPEQKAEDIEAELTLFHHALESVRKDMRTTAEKLSDLHPEEQALFDVYLRMLDDKSLSANVCKLINEGSWAQGALRQVMEEHVRHFEMMDDPYFQERAADVRDLGCRVLFYLQKADQVSITYPNQCVVVSEELTPTMFGDIPRDKLVGLVSILGSSNSHVAILARAMGIPTVMGAVNLPYGRMAGRELIVDGNLGRVYSSPSVDLLRHYQKVVNEEWEFSRGLESLKDKPCITPDHYRIPLWVNTGLLTDSVRSLEHGAEGVGLYRTEVPFMIRESFPSEVVQEELYREHLAAFAPRPVTMRTLDIGGDKSLSYFPIREDNPFLGWRGIRVTLDHPEIFLVQVRAMLKASVGLDNLRLMLPMVTDISEVDEALHLVRRAHIEVQREGFDVLFPQFGVMIEVPATVYQVRHLARRVDFLSVGSNDLIQYILAVDRNNPRVADLYHALHPAVLQVLQKIVDDAHQEGKSVGICGEMAGDPAAAVLLMAMGFDVLSMNATQLLKVKWTLRSMAHSQAKAILNDVMTMDNPRDIRNVLELALRQQGLDQVISG